MLRQILALDHIQLAMPMGREEEAEGFYAGVLGFVTRQKPAELADRGGCWFRSGDADLHLGVDPNFVPASKAHPAFLTNDLDALGLALEATGVNVVIDTQVAGFRRFYCSDPFGNRLEFLERVDPATRRVTD